MKEIAALDAKSEKILTAIRDMLWALV
jgi:hypothetical protein